MIRLLLVEDQAMFRSAVAQLLELEEDLEVVAEVADGTEAVQAALRARPDVALVDIELPPPPSPGARTRAGGTW